MQKNIKGIFKVHIDGTEYDMKNSLGLTEDLEIRFKRPLTKVLQEAYEGHPYMSDIVDVFYLAIKNAGNSVEREILGQAMIEEGMSSFNAIYIEFLTYSLIGETVLRLEPATEEIKKK